MFRASFRFLLVRLVLLGVCGFSMQGAAEAPATPEALDRLLAESRNAEGNEPERAVRLGREALTLAQRLPGHGPELRARARLAEALARTSNYTEARTVVDGGLALPESRDDRAARAQVIQASGQVYWNRGDYAQAEKCFIQAQHIGEELGERRLIIRALSSRGIVARHQKNLPQASEHYRHALTLAEAAGEAELKLQIQNNLAVLLVDLGDFAGARALLIANLEIHTAQNNRRGMANALINLGVVENAMGNHQGSLDYYSQALALRQELGIPRHIAAANVAVALSLTKLGRADEALRHLRVALPIAEKVASHELWGNVYAAFCEAHAAKGEYREALDYQRKAETENSIVSGEKTATTVAELRERFEAEKRQREIAELRNAQHRHDSEIALKEAELLQSQYQRYGLAVMLGLGLVTVTAVIGRQRAKAQAARVVLEETRRARDAAEEAHAVKTRLLDLASHDLKAPLVGVMMTADGIADESADRPEVANRARALKQESQRMFALVRNLLDTSALEAGELALEQEPLDLAGLARDVAAELRPRAERKQQHLLVETEAAPMRGDAARLRQVIENLLDNAMKFSPAGATLRLSVRQTNAARIEVVDQGPGLTDEDRAALFRRFRRLSAVPTGGESSHGLGLALAHDLVARQGGRLWAESKPGAGATFIAEFPLGQPSSG